MCLEMKCVSLKENNFGDVCREKETFLVMKMTSIIMKVEVGFQAGRSRVGGRCGFSATLRRSWLAPS